MSASRTKCPTSTGRGSVRAESRFRSAPRFPGRALRVARRETNDAPIADGRRCRLPTSARRDFRRLALHSKRTTVHPAIRLPNAAMFCAGELAMLVGIHCPLFVLGPGKTYARNGTCANDNFVRDGHSRGPLRWRRQRHRRLNDLPVTFGTIGGRAASAAQNAGYFNERQRGVRRRSVGGRKTRGT